MLRGMAAGALTVLVLLLSATVVSADPPPPGNGVSCPNRHCGVGAVDPGAAGSPGAGTVAGGGNATRPAASDSDTDVVDDDGGTTGGSRVVSAPACSEQPMSPQPAAGTAWWEGHSAADGLVMQWVCTGGLTAATCTYCTVLTPHFVASPRKRRRCSGHSPERRSRVRPAANLSAVDRIRTQK